MVRAVSGPAAVAPQLGGNPLFGALPTFRRDRVELLDALAATPGDVVGMRLGRRAYLLKRPEDVQHVLVARHTEYPKGPRNVGARARRIFGAGLFTSTAEGHRG